MKLAFESTLLLGNRSGVGNYMYYLAGELCRSPEIEEINFIANGYKKSGNLPLFPATTKARYYQAWVPQSLSDRLAYEMWYHWYLGSFVKKKAVDVIHFPSLIGAKYSRCKTVATVHDLSFATFYPRTKLTEHYWEYGLRSAKLADRVITDSLAAKQDLMNIWDITESKINVIPLGCGPEFRLLDRAKCAAEIKKELGLDLPFILYVGNIEPRKNLTFLIKAFAEALKRTPGLKLVIAGRQGMPYPEFYQALADSPARESIVIIDSPSTEMLVRLYNTAACFCYPSLMEGFGLPVLEAFNCGCPVIAADNSSIPEVAGEAAVLLDANDHQGWVTAIQRLATETTFADDYRLKGQKRAMLFSWEKCAKQTIDVYKGML
jgi:glycosyltransferase involved in cell wall biosynthesis